MRGYLRADGRKGIRNVVVVGYLVECAHHVAREIALPFRDCDVHVIGFPGCYPNPHAQTMMERLEKFGRWSDLPTHAAGDPDLWSTFSEEDLITDIMLYVAPSSVVTSTWMYRGKRLEGSQVFPAGTRIRVPTGVAAFPDPVFVPPPRSFAEKTYNVVHWTDMPKGGHFAAMEQPDLMLADLRAFVATISPR